MSNLLRKTLNEQTGFLLRCYTLLRTKKNGSYKGFTRFLSLTNYIFCNFLIHHW